MAIRIPNVELLGSTASWTGTAHDFNLLLPKMTLRLLQIVDLKSDMCGMTICKVMVVKGTRCACCASPRGLTQQVNFSAPLCQPDRTEARNFMHSKHLSVKLARSFDILDHERGVIQF